MPGWSSVDGQYTDPAPQSVADEQCDMMSHSEQVSLACAFLSDELPATDNLIPRTVARLAQADYTILVTPSLDFLFLKQ